jgi:predicted DNA-binding protein (MmcQ/YjbR family)
MPNARLDYPFGKDVAVYKVFVSDKSGKSSSSHLDAVQGTAEERTEPYISTVKGVPQDSNAAVRQEPLSEVGSAELPEKAVRGDWKMFALITEGKEPVQISLKCDPQLAVVLREKYDEVMPGYHLNKKHWNTLVLGGQLPWEEVQGLIRHSYDLVVSG